MKPKEYICLVCGHINTQLDLSNKLKVDEKLHCSNCNEITNQKFHKV